MEGHSYDVSICQVQSCSFWLSVARPNSITSLHHLPFSHLDEKTSQEAGLNVVEEEYFLRFLKIICVCPQGPERWFLVFYLLFFGLSGIPSMERFTILGRSLKLIIVV